MSILPSALRAEITDLICGSLLGSGKLDPGGYYSLTKGWSRRKYVEHAYEVLKPFDPKFDGRTTRTSLPLEELRGAWYSPKKTLPQGFLLNARSLAYWFCDKGVVVASRRRIELSSKLDLTRLAEMVEEMGIGCYAKGGKLKIRSRSFYDFLELVEPRVPFLVDVPVRSGHARLDLSKARSIRAMYASGGYTQKVLAEMFGVSVKSINHVVNNKSHRESNIGLRGSAGVTVTFRYP